VLDERQLRFHLVDQRFYFLALERSAPDGRACNDEAAAGVQHSHAALRHVRRRR
jgi:hypothetical protein